MPDLVKPFESKDEIRLNDGKYLIETSKGEIVYRTGKCKYWEQREQATKVAEYWSKQHAVYVHLYRLSGGFLRWVGYWVGGKPVKMNEMGF